MALSIRLAPEDEARLEELVLIGIGLGHRSKIHRE